MLKINVRVIFLAHQWAIQDLCVSCSIHALEVNKERISILIMTLTVPQLGNSLLSNRETQVYRSLFICDNFHISLKYLTPHLDIKVRNSLF